MSKRRGAWDELVRQRDTARRQRDRLVEFAEHALGCGRTYRPCVCGLAMLLEEIADEKETE